MDDQYQQGFERLLSDMSEPPEWEQVSTQRVAVPPVRSQSHGLLVAAAAFAVTVVAVGAVVFAFRGDGEPVATPAEATIDHIEVSWSQEVDLQCAGMKVYDNGGAAEARIDIWGPNADGLVRVDATAPNGTVEQFIMTHPFDRASGWKVWSPYERGFGDDETVFLIAGCADETASGSSTVLMSDPPFNQLGHAFIAFISTPTVLADGSPFDFEAGLALDATVREDTWRGIPVKVFTRDTADVDDHMGASVSVDGVWFDPAARRLERMTSVSRQEATGTVTTTIEVVERDTVPADSVSFSTDGLTLTLDMPPVEPSSDEVQATTTTTMPPDAVDVADLDDVDSTLDAINRQHALIDDAMQHRDDAEEAIRRERAALEALEAESDPRASERELERQRAILRVAELQKRQFEAILAHNEAILAQLEERRSELVNVLEGLMAADRAAAEARAAEHAPYVVTEPIGLAPPPALPGNDGASGSGCYPGPGDLPDGIWFGYLVDRDGPTIDFELRCMYFGEAAWAYAEASSTDADGDIVIMDHDTVVRTLGTAADADVWMVTGDAAEGRHEPFSFAHEWTGDESTYASCPGEGCPVWIYINDGVVDAIVQQYLP